MASMMMEVPGLKVVFPLSPLHCSQNNPIDGLHRPLLLNGRFLPKRAHPTPHLTASVMRRKALTLPCLSSAKMGWQKPIRILSSTARGGKCGSCMIAAALPSSSSSLSISSNTTSSSGSSLSAMLPYIVAATAIAALAQPATFSWVSKEYYAPALGGIMLSVGIKLSPDDFAMALRRPLLLSIGLIAQYMLKPLLGLLIVRVFGAPPMFYAGFILTCCVAGAQLSNYASYLSQGDVALSILLTSTTTVASAVITPLLTGVLMGSAVHVDAIAMSRSILQVVLIPVALGLFLNKFAKPLVETVVKPVMPVVAMVCTSLTIGSPLALNRAQILSTDGLRLLFPVLSFHVAAFTLGYWLSKLPFMRQEDESVCRTISLCTGMQSSTMAGLLATQFLAPSHAVPAACSVVAMATMGLGLASFWGSGSRIRDIIRGLFPVQFNRVPSPASSS